jgi:multisubunit Na+/H+ antiporter MnhG subunit
MNTERSDWRLLLIGGVAMAAFVAAFFLDPIAQDPGYHDFADRRPHFGIPNFWNVATNLPFLFIGVAGLTRLPKVSLRLHFTVFCAGVALVSVGSAWYHLEPSTSALVFDRLPMTVAFMALFAAVIADRISMALGRALLWPFVALGIASIGWWHLTERAGVGDLRPYAIVQFLPMLLTPLMLLLFKSSVLQSRWLWASLAAYAGAKVAEYLDSAIYSAGQLLSGHSIKHLLAALAVWCVIRAFQRSPARAL